ncbi:Ig-like domain-containing protein [Candidatus Woesebacteria bacterium]|nr:Ig-like domain-containing protein [Candidatus Woesebacteria bacterium]
MESTQILKTFELQLVMICIGILLAIASLIRANRAMSQNDPLRSKTFWVLVSMGCWGAMMWGLWTISNKVAAVPKVTTAFPNTGGSFNPVSPSIALRFEAPINYQKISIHTYPEVDMFVHPQGFWANLFQFGTSLTIVPRTTLPPGQNYMVYISNIEGPWTKGYGGERLFSITNPDVRVVESSVKHDDMNVPTEEKFLIHLENPIVSEKEWTVRMQPSHEMHLRAIDSKTLEITPLAPLHQGIKYSLSLLQTPILLTLTTKAEMTRLEERVVHSLDFTTVKPAYISTISPQGDSVNPSEPFSLVFDQPMSRESVNTRISITPTTPLEYRWNQDDTTLTLEHSMLPKDTAYTLTLNSGIQTKLGGTLESAAAFTFKTAGPLMVKDLSPSNAQSEVSQTATIEMTFNQEVSSNITKYFEIQPPIAGAMSVSKNKLIFTPKQPLADNTTYTVTLANGAPSAYGLPTTTDTTTTFTTKPKEVLLDVPYYHQQSNFTCNIAAARMLLSYRGIQTTEAALIHTIGLGGKRGSGNPSVGYIDDYGTYWPAILRGIATHRPARLLESGNLVDILHEIDRGNPVMTWGQNGWSDPHDLSWTASDGTRITAINGMHSSVVRGYRGTAENPSLIYINDPWRGQYSISPAEFMRRWKYLGIALVID